MPELLREARPVARKTHRCGMCNGRIQPGETYRRDTYKYDYLYDFLTCDACERDGIVNEVWAWSDRCEEGVTLEQAEEWARETVEWAKSDELRSIAKRWLERYTRDGGQ